jgi:hypothetical protein
MSIKVKTVMIESPRAFQIFNEYYLSFPGKPLIEHSPIYTEFTAEVNISGSYTDSFTAGDIDYDYSYTGSKTWTRVPIVGDSTSPSMDKIKDSVGGININGVSESPEASIGNIVPASPGEFLMALAPALDKPSGPFEDAAPMYAPKYPAAVFSLTGPTGGYDGMIESSAVIGTRTDRRSSPPLITDIVEDIRVSPGFFFSDGKTDPRQIVDELSIQGGSHPNTVARISEDVTAWSAAKWRDFRGTYEATAVNAQGITTTVTVTLA